MYHHGREEGRSRNVTPSPSCSLMPARGKRGLLLLFFFSFSYEVYLSGSGSVGWDSSTHGSDDIKRKRRKRQVAGRSLGRGERKKKKGRGGGTFKGTIKNRGKKQGGKGIRRGEIWAKYSVFLSVNLHKVKALINVPISISLPWNVLTFLPLNHRRNRLSQRERGGGGKIPSLLSSIVGSIWAAPPPKVPHRRPCTLGIVIPMEGKGRKRRSEVSNLLSCQKSLSFLPPSRFISQPCSGASPRTHPYISIEAGHFLVLRYRCNCAFSPPLGKTIVWMASYVDGEG